MLSEIKIHRKRTCSQEKVKAFANDILQQCQEKGFTLQEVEALTELIEREIRFVDYVYKHTTVYRFEA